MRSSYIDRLVAREKKARAKSQPELDEVIKWHQKQAMNLRSAIIGAQHGHVCRVNAKIEKYRIALTMHERTAEYLTELAASEPTP